MNRSRIKELLTDKEINECLGQAFRKLPAEEQECLQLVIDELVEIPRLGSKSALRLIFAVEQQVFAVEDKKKNLPRLNEILKGG